MSLSAQGYCDTDGQHRGGWIGRVYTIERCPMSCGLCASAGGWATPAPSLAPTPRPTSSCPSPVDLRPECAVWQGMGFCTDTGNPTLMGFMAEQCALSCGFSGCPEDSIGGESGSSAAVTQTTPTTTLTTTLTITPSTTSVTTSSAPTSSAPTTSEPTTSEPSTSPSAARGRLIPIQVPTAVSALDAASLDITVGWDVDLDVGPVELVPRFAYLRPLDDASLVRASGENVMLQEPIHLNGSSGVTTITLNFMQSRVPMPPGI